MAPRHPRHLTLVAGFSLANHVMANDAATSSDEAAVPYPDAPIPADLPQYHTISEVEVQSGVINLSNQDNIGVKPCGVKNSVYNGAADGFMETYLECGTHTYTDGTETNCGLCPTGIGIAMECSSNNLCIDPVQPGKLIKIKSVDATLYEDGADLSNVQVGQWGRIDRVAVLADGQHVTLDLHPHVADGAEYEPPASDATHEQVVVKLPLEPSLPLDAFEIVDGYQTEYVADFLDAAYITEDYHILTVGAQERNINYFGFQDRTITGRLCAPWAQFPKDMTNSWIPEVKREDGIGNGHHNFCRNPDKMQMTMWCYLLEPYFNDQGQYIFKEDCQALNGVKTTTQPPAVEEEERATNEETLPDASNTGGDNAAISNRGDRGVDEEPTVDAPEDNTKDTLVLIVIIVGSSLAGLAIIYYILAKRREHLTKVQEITAVKTQEKFERRQEDMELEKEMNAPAENDRAVMMKGLKEAEAIKDAQKLKSMAMGNDAAAEEEAAMPNMVVSQDHDGSVLIAVQRKTEAGDATISHIL